MKAINKKQLNNFKSKFSFYLKTYVITTLFLIMNILSFSEVPHSYVTENPKKEIQRVETFKQREKAELNLSVTKVKSKEIKDGNITYYPKSKTLKIILEKNNYSLLETDKFLISKSGENIFSINRLRERNKLRAETKLCKAVDTGIFKEMSTTFDSNPQMIYLTILDKNYNIKEILKYSNIKVVQDEVIRGETDLYLTEYYDRGSEKIYFRSFKYDDLKGPQEIEFSFNPIGVSLKKISGYGLVQMKENDILVINDTQKIEIKSRIAEFDEVLVDTKVNSNNLKINGDIGRIVLKEVINSKATVDKYSLKLQLLRENKIIMEHKFNVYTTLFNKIENHIKYEYDIENDFQENNIVDLSDYTIGLDKRMTVIYKSQEETLTQLNLKDGEKLKNLIINNQEIIIGDENNYPSKILTLENNLKVELLKGKKLTFKILNYELNPFFITIEEETEINNEIINSKIEASFQKKTFNQEIVYKTNTKWTIEDGVYKGEWIENDYWNGGFEAWDREGLKLINWYSNHPAFSADALGNYSLLPLEDNVELLKVNGITIPEAKGVNPEFKGTLKISEDYVIEYRTKKGTPNIFTYRFIKYPKKDFKLDLYLEFENSKGEKACHNYNSYYQYFPLIEFNQTLTGNSNLRFAEYYPVNEFVQFTANPTIQNAQPLALDNSVRDVTLETTGKGLVAMQQGDKLTVDGHEVVIGAGGNIGPQKLTTGNIKYTYEVKNGKFRIALNEWGILEPDRTIPIKIVRNENGSDKSLAEHNLTIKAIKNKVTKWESKVVWEIDDSYNGAWIERDKSHADYNVSGDEDPWGMYYKGLKAIEANGTHFAWSEAGYTLLPLEGKISSLVINEKSIPNVESGDFSGRITLGVDFEIEYRVRKDGYPSIFTYRFIKFPKKDFKMTLDLKGTDNNPHSQGDYQHIYENNYKYKEIITTLKGNSNLKFAEYYPINEFVQFTANPTIQNAGPLALDNFVRDVTFETTGKGLVAMQQGDKLTVDGHEVVIGAGGNIGPQKLTTGNIKYTYEVKNGKFRIALNEWGILEPDRTISIKIERNENGKINSLSEHNLTIKAPRKVEGSSNLEINQQYTPRTTIRFQGISLTAPSPSSLESPIPAGVTLSSQEGQGIPFMKEGDILEISDGITRVLRTFNILANGTLDLQTVKMTTSELGISVQSGKLRLALNNWFSERPINLHISLKRNTNKIMNHNIVMNVPSVPKVEGTSNLDITNSYKNEYIKFNSCTLDNLKPISLINPVTGVNLNSLSGNGLLELQANDTLNINGQQHMLNSNSLAEQNLNLNGINLSYKVENGKIQLRINSYDLGVSQAQTLTLKVTRTGKEVMSHTMNITVPNVQKLVGQSSLTIAKEYANEYIPFTSCTLESQQDISLERLITGVRLQQTTGKGLLTLENGDTLDINGQQHMLNSNSLTEQNLNLNGINLSYKVENGKIQLRINSYDLGVSQAQTLTLKVTRTGKEVMSHTMNITVPNLQKLVGESGLSISKNYTNEYIKFNSCTLYNPNPISLISPVTGVNLNSLSGNGLLELQANDTLNINGQQHMLNSNSLAEQNLNLNGINLSYKVENGKIQLRINSYDLEVSQAQTLTLKVTRTGKEVMSHTMNITVPNVQKLVGQSSLTIAKEYANEYIPFTSCTLESQQDISLERLITGVRLQQTTGKGLLTLENGDTLDINGQQHMLNSNSLTEQNLNLNGINLSYKVENGKIQLRINSYDLGVTEAQPLTLKVTRTGKEVMNHTMNITVPNLQKLVGQSTLILKEYYPINEFINFSSTSLKEGNSLTLENNLRDVTFETTGKGLVAMQQGDKLTIDGNQVVIGASGNVGPQKLTTGNIKYTYEVKNGKFRIALNEWGILEPDRTISIKIERNENGKINSLSEHNLTIKAPRKVKGSSLIKLNQDYNVGNIIKFEGISLQGGDILKLEKPIPFGVSLSSTTGQGIPFMKEGDTLEITDGFFNKVKTFIIEANGTLTKQEIKIDNGILILYVEEGKLRIGISNYVNNTSIKSNIKITRGTNEIMNHSMEIKVPEIPFNIKKEGLLDFGNVTAGMVKTSKTEIVLEMLKDVSDVKFNLKDPQPILENADKSNSLKVDNIEYSVEQREKEYKINLKGKLKTPEGTKSGEYIGNTVLELKIK